MFYDEVERFKNNVALFLDRTNKIFYRDIVAIAEKFKKKIKKRSLTILITENSFECICGYISLLRANNPLMLLDSNIKKRDLEFIINKFAPEFIYCSIASQKKLPQNFFNLIYSFKDFSLLKVKRSFYINTYFIIIFTFSSYRANPK